MLVSQNIIEIVSLREAVIFFEGSLAMGSNESPFVRSACFNTEEKVRNRYITILVNPPKFQGWTTSKYIYTMCHSIVFT